MAELDELIAANEAIRALLASGAEEQLRALPGVTHVSVGLKETGGRVTDQLAIRVYVDEKKPPGDLAPAERIPPEVDGVPTDVNLGETEAYFTADNARYRPVKGGIQITNRIIDLTDDGLRSQIAAATLGCIATYDADRSAVLLSNWHVLTDNTGRKGDAVYQPAPSVLPRVNPADLPLRPTDDTDSIANILDAKVTDKVDGAIARIDVSSWCRCCGIDYRNEINGLSLGGHPPTNVISGQRAAVGGETVYKVGAATGRTIGRVVDGGETHNISITRRGVTHAFTGQIVIASTDPTRPFAAKGDSGSVVIGEDNKIVGLQFASNDQAPPAARAYANHISDVCAALGITINFTAGAGTHAGAPLAVPSALVVDPEAAAETYRAVRERLLREPSGAWLLQLAEAHREEIVHLVNDNRRVTVAWHRAGGPALFATVLNAVRSGSDELPNADPANVLERMGAVLAAHGSTSLREAIEEHGPPALAALRESERLDELLAKLNTSVPSHV